MTVVWVNKAWAQPAAQSDVLGTDLDVDVRPLPFPSSGRVLKLLFLLLVLPFVPITWRTIQPEKDKFHNLSCQAVRWSLPFRRAARSERVGSRARRPLVSWWGLGAPLPHSILKMHLRSSLCLSFCPPAGLPWDGQSLLGKSSVINVLALLKDSFCCLLVGLTELPSAFPHNEKS